MKRSLVVVDRFALGFRVPASAEPERRRLVAAARRHVAAWRFPRARAPSRVTLPLVFER